MEISTYVNGLKLEHSNTIIVYKKQSVILSLNHNYKIKISFNDDEEKEQNISFNVAEKGLELVLNNFQNALGTSSSQPIEFGAINGKSLYISVSVQAINDVKILHYDICIEE